ncbi:DUF3034 family protein [Halomonas sp. CH40]
MNRLFWFRPSALAVMIAGLLLMTLSYAHAGSRILGTGGVSAIEGAAGGGLSPWAVLSGTASDTEVGVTASTSYAGVDDFQLNVMSASINFYDRVEFSVARQNLELSTLGGELEQDIYATKIRLFGDLLYHRLGIWSAGMMYKQLADNTVPDALGARHAQGREAYISASKLFLDAVYGRNLLLNATLRRSSANQGGLLGFAGDQGGYHWLAEGSMGVFVTPQWVVGSEYRQKPDNLSAVKEEDWYSVYSAYFFSKHLSLTAAWLNLGDIAGFSSQRGGYISLQAAF